MKHRIVHALQKYVLNTPIKLLFAVGIVPPRYALLETTGRKTGKPRRTPVGDARVGYQFWIVAEHGMKAGYVRNIVSNPRVRLKLRDGLRARWYTGAAHARLMMIRGSDSSGWQASYLRAAGMRRRCDYSGPTCLRCGLIWMGEFHGHWNHCWAGHEFCVVRSQIYREAWVADFAWSGLGLFGRRGSRILRGGVAKKTVGIGLFGWRGS
jgi:deazaflavin-dependent oxidoreductase (nitroreductase family)